MPRLPSFGSSLLLLAALAGCHDGVTQVVVVFQSDLVIPTETDGLILVASEGPFAPDLNAAAVNSFAPLLDAHFPLSIGVASAGSTPTFSMTVQLLQGFANAQGVPPLIVVNRTVTDIRFVDQQSMMLVLPLLRACACQGTSCPSPGDPQCDSIDTPTLQPFDATVAPPSTMMPAGINITPHPPTTPRP